MCDDTSHKQNVFEPMSEKKSGPILKGVDQFPKLK